MRAQPGRVTERTPSEPKVQTVSGPSAAAVAPAEAVAAPKSRSESNAKVSVQESDGSEGSEPVTVSR